MYSAPTHTKHSAITSPHLNYISALVVVACGLTWYTVGDQNRLLLQCVNRMVVTLNNRLSNNKMKIIAKYTHSI